MRAVRSAEGIIHLRQRFGLANASCFRLIQFLIVAYGFASTLRADTRVYTYDSAGQLAGVTASDGTTILYEYDLSSNRVSRRVVFAGSDSVSAIIPGKSGAGEVIQSQVIGRGLAGTTGIIFEHSGIVARLLPTATDQVVPVEINIAADVPPGSYAFTVQRGSSTPISSKGVVLHVSESPVLLSVDPAEVSQGETVEAWRLHGVRLDGTTEIRFDDPVLTADIVEVSSDGREVLARLQVGLNAQAGDYTVRVVAPGGSSNTTSMHVNARARGLLGDFFDRFFAIDSAGLPVLPSGNPTFQRPDPSIAFGAPSYNWRPCFQGSQLCVGGGFTVRWQGFIYLARAGTYTFGLNAADAAVLKIDGAQTVAVSDTGTHPHPPASATGTLTVDTPGSYAIELTANSFDSAGGVDLLYQGPGAPALVAVPGDILWDKTVADGSGPGLALASLSFFNPEPPEASLPTTERIAVASVSFFNPEPPEVPLPSTDRIAISNVSFFNPEPPEESAGPTTGIAEAAVSFFNPLPPSSSNGSQGRLVLWAVSFFNPQAPFSSQDSSEGLALQAVSFSNLASAANGASLRTSTQPKELTDGQTPDGSDPKAKSGRDRRR